MSKCEKCCRKCIRVDWTDDHWDLSKERPYCDLGEDEFDYYNDGFCMSFEHYADHQRNKPVTAFTK